MSRWRRNAALCALAYGLLAALVTAGWLGPLDVAVLRAAHAGTPCAVVTASSAVSLALSGQFSLAYAGALAVACAWRRRPLAGAGIVVALLGTVAVELVCKRAIPQATPGDVLGALDRAECLRSTLSLPGVAIHYSLPSGFAIRAAFFGILVAAALAAFRPPLARAAIMVATATVLLLGATRVVLAWHWPSDILAGFLLGAAAACAALDIADGFAWLRPDHPNRRRAGPGVSGPPSAAPP